MKSPQTTPRLDSVARRTSTQKEDHRPEGGLGFRDIGFRV